MDVVIIANFCMDFGENDNGRFSYLSELLCKRHDVEIVTSSFFHITKKQRGAIVKHNYKITFIKERGYKKNISIGRFVSHFQWGLRVGEYLKNRKKPDVIYCAIPSLTAANTVVNYCKKNNVELVVDIQDLWPESFQIAFNVPIISKVCFYPFKIVANRAYKNADTICAVSETFVDRGLAVNKKMAKGYAVYLGTDLDKFDKNKDKEMLIHKDVEEICIAYCGTLGSSYDLKCVIDAIDYLHDSKIRLVLMGDGPKRTEFEEYAQKKNVNASFCGRLSYDEMCSVLSKCDITVNPIVGTSVSSIINKHADYAASGLPVLNTQNSKEYIDLVDKYHMGLNSKPGDYIGLSNNLKLLIENQELRNQMGKNARQCAEEKFNRKFTYQTLVHAIEDSKK